MVPSDLLYKISSKLYKMSADNITLFNIVANRFPIKERLEFLRDPLFTAIDMEDLELCKYLVEECNINPKTYSSAGKSVIIYMLQDSYDDNRGIPQPYSSKKRLEILEYFITKSVSIAGSLFSRSALELACIKRWPDAVRMLLKHDPTFIRDPPARGAYIRHVINYGYMEIIAELIPYVDVCSAIYNNILLSRNMWSYVHDARVPMLNEKKKIQLLIECQMIAYL